MRIIEYFFTAGALYLNIWNFVDFPAGVVRFGTESGNNIDSYDDQGETLFKRAKMVNIRKQYFPVFYAKY